MILASLFQNGAVLQRDMDIPVWGKTDGNTFIEAELDGKVSHTRSAADGSFLLYFPAHPAGGPYSLTVSAPKTGKSVTLQDVMIGEVWLASGQSNMEYALGSKWMSSPDTPEECTAIKQKKLFDEMVNDPDKLRVFTVQKTATGARENSCPGTWLKMTPENSTTASAVGAWFGLGLQMHLDVTVGIIASSWGGTIAEAWTSCEALTNNKETASLAKLAHRTCWANKNWENPPAPDAAVDFSKIPGVQTDPGIAPDAAHFADVDFDDSKWKIMQIPGSWIKQNISGNGALWVRKSVTIPESWANQPLTLTGGAVDKHDITFFNGVEIGRTGKDFETQYFDKIRSYKIAPELVKTGKAVVAVRAYSFAYDGSLRGNWQLVNDQTKESIELNGLWQAAAELDLGILNYVRNSPVNFGPGNPNTPGILFDGMINPLLPYAIKGAIWYQGESNASEVKKAIEYRDILQNMIDDWRRAFRNPDLPFIMVQLAGFGLRETFDPNSSWAELRESQRLLCLSDPDTFMASAIDIGEEDDIHPQNKFDVGKRLAMSALYNVYGCNEATPSGPEVNKVEVMGNTLKFSFNYGEGLKLVSDEKSFHIAGADGIFYSADVVKVDDKTDELLISSSKVAEPCAVKYAWSNFPICTLYNGAGLPASSFHWILEK